MGAARDNLTPRQRRFVEEYLLDLNSSQAAVRAGYSERSADKIGPELLGKTRVREAVVAAQRARSERTGITADYVLARLKAEAEFTGEGASHSARVAALKAIGQHLGMFAEKREPSGPNGGPIRTEQEQADRLALFRERYAAACAEDPQDEA